MMMKTLWQWLAMVCWIVGLLLNLMAWHYQSWLLVLSPFFFWGIALGCVVLKPARKKL